MAAAMELLNEIAARRDDAEPEVVGFAASTLVSLMQPFAPHVAEELWEQLGGERLWREPWPVADERFLVHDTFEIVVQVNGKLRGRFGAPAASTDEELTEPRARARRTSRATSTGTRSCA